MWEGGRTDLEHVGEQTENRVEAFELVLLVRSVGDSGEELSEDAEIDDERRGEERILTFVEDVLLHRRVSLVRYRREEHDGG